MKKQAVIALCIFVVLIIALGGGLLAERAMRTRILAEEITAVAVPLEDGVWELHLEREPTRIYEWQHEDHFAVGVGNSLVIFDGDEIWYYGSKNEELSQYSTGQEIDYELGAAGVMIDRFKGHVVNIFYLLQDSQRWETVSWSEQPVSVCTLARVRWDEGHASQTFYYDPASHDQLPVEAAFDNRYSVATREDGLHCIVFQPLYGEAERYSDWFEAAPTDILTMDGDKGLYMITRVEGGELTRESMKMYGAEGETWYAESDAQSPLHADALRLTEAPSAYWGIGDYIYRTKLGGLRYSGGDRERITRGAYISAEQFAQAQLYGTTVVLPDGDGVRVYVRFKRDIWERFDLDVGMDIDTP